MKRMYDLGDDTKPYTMPQCDARTNAWHRCKHQSTEWVLHRDGMARAVCTRHYNTSPTNGYVW